MDSETGEYVEVRPLLAVENRVWVPFDEIPKDIINAAVAIEDKRFWEHDGVDWMRTLSACALFLKESKTENSQRAPVRSRSS